MEKILLTGGAGFIGSHMAEHLWSLGYSLYVLDKLTYAGNIQNLATFLGKPRFHFVKGDIRDRNLVRELFKKVDKIIHFAAETHIDRSLLNPSLFVQTDFVGTYTLLEEFKKNPRQCFLHISTSEVYGNACQIPMNEDHPLNPQSPYAATKTGADRLCYSYFYAFNLPIVVIRPFNTYGPRQYPEKLIPFFITNALEDKPLFIYGNGENTRDWIYVKDLVKTLTKILESNVEKIKGKVFNIGTGEEKSVNEIAHLILEILNKPASLIKYVADRKGHVTRLIADSSNLKKYFNHQPEVPFEEGLKLTIEWYCQNKRWWQRIKNSKRYKNFYYLNYEKRAEI